MWNGYLSLYNICSVEFLKVFFEFWIVGFHCLLYSHLLLLCLCWCIAAHLSALLPVVDQWNRVKPQAGMCIVSPACM